MPNDKPSTPPAQTAAPFRVSDEMELSELSTGVSRSIDLHLRVTDPDVIAELSRLPEIDRESAALSALRVGVLAMRGARGSIDVAAVRDQGKLLMAQLDAAIKAHQKDLENRMGHTLDKYLDPKSGVFAQRADGIFGDGGSLVAKLKEHISGDNSHLAAALAKQVGENSPFLRHFSPTEKEGVIARIEGAVNALLDEQKKVVLDEFDLHKEDSAINRLLKGVQKLNASVTDEFSLDNKSSALNKLNTMIEATKLEIHKQLSLDEENSSIARLNKQLGEQVKALSEQQAKFQAQVNETLQTAFARKSEREKSTLHGEDFERDASSAVRELACGPSDLFDEVGANVGKLPNSKVGDAVLTLGEESACPGARIAFEFKQDARYDPRKAREELEIACTNREAGVGVFVMSKRIADDSRHAGSWDSPLVRTGNLILVTWHPDDESTQPFLSAACSLARALVMRESISNENQVDWGTVDAQLLEIDKQIERFENITKQCSTIRGAVDKIEEELRKLSKKLKGAADKLSDQVDAMREA